MTVKHYEVLAKGACGARVSLAYRALHIQDVTCAPCLRILRGNVEDALAQADGQRLDESVLRALRERQELVAESLAVAEAREWLEHAGSDGCEWGK